MIYCIVGLWTSLLLLILPYICPIFFLSILWWNFSSKISVKLCKLEYSYLVCRLIMMYCIVGLRTSLLLLIRLCICPIFLIFFLSILWMMTFSSKISLKLCKQARVFIFGMQVDNDVLYRGIANQPSPAYSSLYLSIFLSLYIFRQRYLHNCIG